MFIFLTSVQPNKPNLQQLLAIKWDTEMEWKNGTGLINYNSTTCYVNSMLQSLFHIPHFFLWLHTISINSSKQPICSTIINLVNSGRVETIPVNNYEFIVAFLKKAKGFDINRHQDSDDFFDELNKIMGEEHTCMFSKKNHTVELTAEATGLSIHLQETTTNQKNIHKTRGIVE